MNSHTHFTLSGGSAGLQVAPTRVAEAPRGEQPWERPRRDAGDSGAPSLPAQVARLAQSEPASPARTGHCRPPVAPREIAGSSHPLLVLSSLSQNRPRAGISLPEEPEEQTAGPQGRGDTGD